MLSDDTVTDIVICLQCEALYKHGGHKTGTSSLNRHTCPGLARSSSRQDPSIQHTLMQPFLKGKFPIAVKSKLVDDFIDFCCTDLSPFDIVSGKDFIRVAQGLINIGARYGPVEADSVRQTICDRAKSRATEKARLC